MNVSVLPSHLADPGGGRHPPLQGGSPWQQFLTIVPDGGVPRRSTASSGNSKASGLSQRRFALSRGINPVIFGYWLRRGRERRAAPDPGHSLVPVRLRESQYPSYHSRSGLTHAAGLFDPPAHSSIDLIRRGVSWPVREFGARPVGEWK
jgi:hypothetical protein